MRVVAGAALAAALIVGWLAVGALSTSRGTGAWAANSYASPTPTRDSTSVTFTVVAGTQPTPTPTPKPTHTHSGGLPVTGNGPLLMWTVVGGVALIGIGGVLIAATRR